MPERPHRPPSRRSNLIWLIGLTAGVVAGALAVYAVAYGATLPS